MPKTQQDECEPESVIAITCFQTGVSWHFRSLKDQVLKIEFSGDFSAKLRLRVRWLSHLAPTLAPWRVGEKARAGSGRLKTIEMAGNVPEGRWRESGYQVNLEVLWCCTVCPEAWEVT